MSTVNTLGLQITNNTLQKISIAPSSNSTPQNGDIWYNGGMQFRNNGITSIVGETNTTSSSGGTQSIVLAKSGVNLPFKGLTAGTNITLTPSGTDVIIAATGGGEANTTSSAGGTVSIPLTKVGVNLPFRGLTAGSTLTLTQNANDVTVAASGVVYNATQNTVFLGSGAGSSNSGANSVAIGLNAGQNNSGSQHIAIGRGSGGTTSSNNCVFLGAFTGVTGNPYQATFLGYGAGRNGTYDANNTFATFIGYRAGDTTRAYTQVAVGANAGFTGQGYYGIAMGNGAAASNQPFAAIAIGNGACATSVAPAYGSTDGSTSAYSYGIGANAGNSQGLGSLAIGINAGSTSQGNYAIAIGANAGTAAQHTSSIIINGTGSALNSGTTSALYIKPIRSTAGTFSMMYTTASGEVSYNSAKTFVINHPFDNDKYLVHACVESPESGVMYRGANSIKDGDVCCMIQLPDYCSKWTNFSVTLTAINSPNPNMYASKVVDNILTVYGNCGKFHWIVHATRDFINVEPEKNNNKLNRDGPYTYI